jgi:hypothetical protein
MSLAKEPLEGIDALHRQSAAQVVVHWLPPLPASRHSKNSSNY